MCAHYYVIHALFVLPFGSVPEQVAADLSTVWDDGGVVEQRLVSDLHLEEAFVSRGQLLRQSSQRQQHHHHHAPAFTLPHSGRHREIMSHL